MPRARPASIAGVLEALSGRASINSAQAETLCDARVPDGVRAGLVAAAGGEDTDATRRRVRRAEAHHCTETPMERFERQRQARGAGWQRDHEGMLRLWAKLDPEVGAQVEASLEALRRQYWLDDKQVRSGRRTPAQRDADVLAYALAAITLTDTDAAAVDRLHARARPSHDLPDQTAAGNPERRLPAAQISVLIELDALRGRTDAMGLTDAGVELPPEIVRRLACDAEDHPHDPQQPRRPRRRRPQSSRTVPLRLRRLLIARDRHCQWPGCNQPPSRCDAHHVHHWIRRRSHRPRQPRAALPPTPPPPPPARPPDDPPTRPHLDRNPNHAEPEPATKPQRTTQQPRGP